MLKTKKIKVLVIDDNFGISFLMRKALELKNYEVEILNSFRNVNEIKEISPNIIFLDISIGKKNGLTISRELKNNTLTKNIPIVMLTGEANTKELAKEAGASDHILKPFGLIRLYKIVEKYTKKV